MKIGTLNPMMEGTGGKSLVGELHHVRRQIDHHKRVLAGTTIDTFAKMKVNQIKDLQTRHDELMKQINDSLRDMKNG